MTQGESWYTPHIKGKKILKMGLGPLGRSYGDIIFLAQNGAELIVTDLRDGDDVQDSVKRIKSELTAVECKRINWVLGRHRKKDFQTADIVLRAPNAPYDSPYIEAVHSKGKVAYSSAAWLCELVRKQFGDEVITIGVTGSKGKSTVTGAIEFMLKQSDRRFHLAGNVRGIANLPVLAKVKRGDIILMELDSWQLQGFGDAHISPDIAVFTNFFPDHMDYYKGSMKRYFKDKANIFRYQKHPCVFASRQAKGQIKEYGRSNDIERIRSVTKQSLPDDWNFALFGDHNLRNLALVYAVGQYLELDEAVVKKGVEHFGGVPGRMEYLGKYAGREFWNDNNSTNPISTALSLEALSNHYAKRLIWWGGGADKKSEYDELARMVKKYSKLQILFPGSGTDILIDKLYADEYHRADSIQEALEIIKKESRRGDVILFSPGCASFGMFANEYDRNDQVVRAIRNFDKK
ncbi:MAG: UDP-N-acetylmuramoyl-L-alanine--D-glutamate ligase [Patescibacteria group bacterium]